jgi:betaine-aldehyde dehydrogenase
LARGGDANPPRYLFYDGRWHEAESTRTIEIYSPGTQESLGHIADASAKDVDAAVRAAHQAFPAWRKRAPQERVAMVKQTAQVLRDRASELGMLDAVDSGNPVRSTIKDVLWMADTADYFAGLPTEMKGESFLTSYGVVDFTLRQPLWHRRVSRCIQSPSGERTRRGDSSDPDGQHSGA